MAAWALNGKPPVVPASAGEDGLGEMDEEDGRLVGEGTKKRKSGPGPRPSTSRGPKPEPPRPRPGLGWAGLGWAALGWAGLGWRGRPSGWLWPV